MSTIAYRLARWAGRLALVCAALGLGPAASAVAMTAGSARSAVTEVLWDQTTIGNTGDGVTVSSQFEPFFADYDSQAADDFEVEAGVVWSITQVFVKGTYEGGSGGNQITSLLVQIYADDAGTPGARLISQTVPSGAISGLGTGEFTVNLAPNVGLQPGRYWLSVQAYKPDFLSTSRQWQWYEKETQVLSGSVWQQPGNAYGKNCLTFQPRIAVCDQPTDSDNYDLVFAVFGTRINIDTRIFMPLARR